MKTSTIAPKITNKQIKYYPVQIIRTYDNLFGEGYELYVYSYRHLITKELAQCFRKLADICRNRPSYFQELKKYYK